MKTAIHIIVALTLVGCAGTTTPHKENDVTPIQTINYPQEFKEFWNNGKTKTEVRGSLFKCDGKLCFEKGHLKMYFENGNQQVEEFVENDTIFSRKEWNESGVLIRELNAHETIEYTQNGNKGMECKGRAVRKKDDTFNSDSAQCSFFYDDGKPRMQTNASKGSLYVEAWNEAGILVKQGGIDKDSKGEYREYWDDGKLKKELSGFLYVKKEPNEQDSYNFNIKKGVGKAFFQNGNMQSHEIHESMEAFHSKLWNEDGILIKEINYPSDYIDFDNDGKITTECHGKLVLSDGSFDIKNGYCMWYTTNGILKKEFRNFLVIQETFE